MDNCLEIGDVRRRVRSPVMKSTSISRVKAAGIAMIVAVRKSCIVLLLLGGERLLQEEGDNDTTSQLFEAIAQNNPTVLKPHV